MIFAVDTQFKQLRKRSLKKIQASAGFEPVTSEVTQFKQLRKRSLKKIQASAGFEPVTSEIPQRSRVRIPLKPEFFSGFSFAIA